MFFYRSTNAKAATGSGGANNAVNGYMAFLLYSVAILACESQFLVLTFFFGFFKNFNFLGSCTIYWIDDLYGCKIICWRVSKRRRAPGFFFSGFQRENGFFAT